MKRFGLVFTLSIVATTAAGVVAVACGGTNAGSAPVSELFPTTVPATYVKIAVTPAPVDTPIPTVAPTSVPSFSAAELDDPVFPDWLDPDLTDQQPSDELVFEGWQEYLTNTFVELGDGRTWSFCASGVVLGQDGEINQQAKWSVKRTAAMSSRQWGKVALITRLISGPREGRDFTFAIISREDGKILKMNLTQSTEITVTRSQKCLDLADG